MNDPIHTGGVALRSYRHSTPIVALDPCVAPRLRILGCSLRLRD